MARASATEIPFEAFASSARRFVRKPVYLLHGDEPFLKEEALALIKKKVLGESNADLCLSEYNGAEVSPATVFDELRTLPFLAGMRLVVIRNAEQFVSNHAESLVRYLEKPSRSGVLVLVASNGKIAPSVLKRIAAVGLVVACIQPRIERLPAWIAVRVREMGKRISRAAAVALAENCGTDLNLIIHQIEKLCLYIGDRSTIDVADVEALVGTDRARASWELGEAVRNRDAAQAVRIIRQIIARDESAKLWLLSSLASELRKTWRARRLMAAGADDAALSAATRIPRRYLPDFKRKVAKFSDEELQKKHELLLQADIEMKTTSADAQIVLEKLVIALCCEGAERTNP